MKRIVGVFLVWLVLALSAHAASFDCAKARTKVEHLICGDAGLSKLDDQLAAKYEEALKDKTKAKAIRHAQRVWEKDRNDCKNVSCIRKIYQTRILSMLAKSTQNPPAATKASSYIWHYELVKGAGQEICEAYRRNLESFSNRVPMVCERRYSSTIKEFSSPAWRELDLENNFLLYKKAEKYLLKEFYSHLNPLSEQWKRYNPENEADWMRKDIEHAKGKATALKAKLYIAYLDLDGTGKEVPILAIRERSCGPHNDSGRTRLYVLNKSLNDIDDSVQDRWGGYDINATISIYRGKPYIESYTPDDGWGNLFTKPGSFYVFRELSLHEMAQEGTSWRLKSICEFKFIPDAKDK